MELSAFKRNNFILNKLLPCLLITMFAIMCLYGSSVYAYGPLDINNISYSFSASAWDEETYSDYNKIIILRFPYNNGDYYEYYFCRYRSSTPLYGTDYDGQWYGEKSHKFYYLDFKSNDSQYSGSNTVIYQNAKVPSNSTSVSFSGASISNKLHIIYDTANANGYNDINLSAMEVVYSDVDLYLNDELVFQPPLQTQPTIVASQVGEVEMNKTLQEILGILPVVIVVLVSLIAIRKGIQFLIARMKKA